VGWKIILRASEGRLFETVLSSVPIIRPFIAKREVSISLFKPRSRALHFRAKRAAGVAEPMVRSAVIFLLCEVAYGGRRWFGLCPPRLPGILILPQAPSKQRIPHFSSQRDGYDWISSVMK
jgi:hypothetical protein